MITKFSPRSVKVTYCYNFNIVTDRLANQPTNHVPSYGPQQEGFEEWLECRVYYLAQAPPLITHLGV